MGRRIDEGDYVREYYQVPARVGARVLWQDQAARIVAFDLAYLVLEVEGVTGRVVAHPTWEVTYPEVDSEDARPADPALNADHPEPDPPEQGHAQTHHGRAVAAPQPG